MLSNAKAKDSSCQFCDQFNLSNSPKKCESCTKLYKSIEIDLQTFPLEDMQKLSYIEFKYWDLTKAKPPTQILLRDFPGKTIEFIDNIRLSFEYQAILSQHFSRYCNANKLICFICKESYTTRSLFNKHCQKHDEDHNLSDVDPVKFRHAINIITSEDYEYNMEKYLSKCNYLYDTYQMGVRSKAISNNKTKDTHDSFKFNCDMCDKSYHEIELLKQHQMNHTNDESKSYVNTKETFVCYFCGEKYSRRQKLAKHIQKRHHDELNISKSSETEEEFECSKCDQIFNTKSRLKKHKKSHGELSDS